MSTLKKCRGPVGKTKALVYFDSIHFEIMETFDLWSECEEEEEEEGAILKFVHPNFYIIKFYGGFWECKKIK